SARGVSFDDEDFAVVAPRRRAVAEFAWKREPPRRCRLPRDFLLRGAARLARPRGENDPRDDRFGDRNVRVEPVLERRTDLRIDGGRRFGVVQTILCLSLELRLLEKDEIGR